MYSSVNTIWVLVGAAMVFLMQAGFFNLTPGGGFCLTDARGRATLCAGNVGAHQLRGISAFFLTFRWKGNSRSI